MLHTYTEIITAYYSCDTQHPCTVVHNILFTVTYEAVLFAKCLY